MRRLILATGNAHKVEEFARLFAEAGLSFEALSAKVLGGMPAVVEDSGSFAGNAALKARALRLIAGPADWVMSDDSGLECEALGGAPGVDTAVYAGEKATAAEHREKLLREMAAVAPEKRRARFVCHLALIDPAGNVFRFFGECPGRIAEAESGCGGFGYDPLFIPDGFEKTFAQLDPETKDRLSHRGRAFAALALAFRDR